MTKIWKGKRFISLVLSLALLVSMLPPLALPANSEEVPQEDTPQVEEEVQYNSGVYGALIGATGTLNFDQWNMMYVSDDPMVDVSEAQELYATDIPVWDLKLVVEAVHWDAETSALWLKVAAAEGYSLPSKLQQAALAREENPAASLTELAEMMEPPITKPAMNHRLKKLVLASKEA